MTINDQMEDDDSAEDYDLHIEAGLIPWKDNDQDEQEWLGTDKTWKAYQKLSE